MHYSISAPHPADRLLQIELKINVLDGLEEVLFQLPSWRPGRYELGNFAKNIISWKAVNERNESLAFKKVSKDCWKVLTNDNANLKAKEIKVRYSYYAAQPDAGSCWVDQDLVYINPVHCCLFVPELIHEQCTVELNLSEGFQIATSLDSGKVFPFDGTHHSKSYFAKDYHQLVDSPIMAATALQHHNYEVEGRRFHIWIHGDCHPDWGRMINDFRRFTVEQIDTMRSMPVTEFHFLVLALPYKFHHGVEHLNSTVLAFGPGNELMKEENYVDFIGLASHELFHVWNVKTIRPHEMMPYDYTRENYSRLGFVYEGVTTYYGDIYLARCGVYSQQQFLIEISGRLQKHLDNYGRFNLSVADSSFDTWLDGYTPGAPWRKTNIYDEGCLIALMCDLMIRRRSNNERSLDDVMRTLYNDFGKKGIGFTEHDYLSILENLANESVADFFIDYVYGTEDYEPVLSDLLHHFGCTITKSESPLAHENHFGFKTSSENKVLNVAPGSPAFKAGLSKEDQILAVDERTVDNNLGELLNYFMGLEKSPKVLLKVSTPMKKLKTIVLEPSSEKYFQRCMITKLENPTTQQQKSFSDWLKSSVRQASKLYGMN